MTTFTTVADRPADRLRWALADTWTIARRDLQHWRNRPGVMVFGWLFPVLMMALFIALLGGAISTAVGGSYIDYIMPGALTMAMFFGLEATMAAVSADASKGVTDRFRSLPMSGFAVVAGRCTADMLNSLITLAVTVAAGMLLGWRPDASAPALITAFALLLLLRFALLWVGLFSGLKIRNQEAATAVQLALWPLLFLSSVFIDTATMPRWLGTIAQANPLSATATAIRDLFGNPSASSSWFTENATLLAITAPALLTIIFLPLSASTYRHLRR
ncbi:ABC transporter permease [Amycolatopsis anabasis]|uniref:ABC transporter permease n=1 Tax=Amycolatopsis anabasis TaxID=1840409 RepID=UPI00131CE1A6|nr:ABC transporter permease [Amycolatopsis anabasis]